MGKGGYIGGGTIIGPHTPEWFGHGSGEADNADPKAPKRFVPEKFRKAEALWRDAFEPPPGPAAAAKRELTTREAAEITNLRQLLKLSQQAHDKARLQLAADREALNKRLAELGLPPED